MGTGCVGRWRLRRSIARGRHLHGREKEKADYLTGSPQNPEGFTIGRGGDNNGTKKVVKWERLVFESGQS